MNKSKVWISVLIGFVILVLSGQAVSYILQNRAKDSINTATDLPLSQNPDNTNTSNNSPKISWQYNGKEWATTGKTDNCPSQITLVEPADLKFVTSVLYPGQIRGNDFKAHGGFRFDNNKDNNLNVVMPITATLWRGSRYLENGEQQIMLDFISDCGVMIKFDHLLTLSPELKKIVDQEIPQGKEGDSRTYNLKSLVNLKQGDLVAIQIGHSKPTLNIGFDFGVYDLSKKNESSKDSSFVSKYSQKSETAYYGICWLDNFSSNSNKLLRALPGGGTEGKTSEFCN